jgi:hypothetical protein
MATHEDWQKAKDKRDAAALQAVRHLVTGNIEAAKKEASKSASFDDEMTRIAKELDR